MTLLFLSLLLLQLLDLDLAHLVAYLQLVHELLLSAEVNRIFRAFLRHGDLLLELARAHQRVLVHRRSTGLAQRVQRALDFLLRGRLLVAGRLLYSLMTLIDFVFLLEQLELGARAPYAHHEFFALFLYRSEIVNYVVLNTVKVVIVFLGPGWRLGGKLLLHLEHLLLELLLLLLQDDQLLLLPGKHFVLLIVCFRLVLEYLIVGFTCSLRSLHEVILARVHELLQHLVTYRVQVLVLQASHLEGFLATPCDGLRICKLTKVSLERVGVALPVGRALSTLHEHGVFAGSRAHRLQHLHSSVIVVPLGATEHLALAELSGALQHLRLLSLLLHACHL